MTASLREIAKALGGEVSGQQALCPGPGHDPADRSLSVRISASSPDGFLTHSFARDDFRACRDLVRERLGFGGFTPQRGAPRPREAAAEKASPPLQPVETDDRLTKIARATVCGTPRSILAARSPRSI